MVNPLRKGDPGLRHEAVTQKQDRTAELSNNRVARWTSMCIKRTRYQYCCVTADYQEGAGEMLSERRQSAFW
jgi:hypothetical protein